MLSLFEEILIQICDELSDNEKISLTSTSSIMDKVKYKIIYRSKIDIAKIYLLPYFDNFENIEIHDDPPKFPKYIKYIHYTTFTRYIPQGTTHLTLKTHIFVPKDEIPLTVTHLTIDFSFDVSIKSTIPSSVTHLTFNRVIYQIINLALLPNVTHLQLRQQYNWMIINRTSSPVQITFIGFKN
jgi:hypothetical protein